MENNFFSQPILNSPYEIPLRHWELDPDGQPTQQILERRRGAEFSAMAHKAFSGQLGRAFAADQR